MHTYCLEREQWLPRPIDEVFSFFSRPENLQVITPAWLDFRMVETPKVLAVGSLIRYRLRWHGLPIRWTTEITEWNPPHRFVDRAMSGPYALWNHEHWFTVDQEGTTMRDRVTYALPFGVGGTPGPPDGGEEGFGEAFRFSRGSHAAALSRLKVRCTNPQASYTNSESGVSRVLAGAFSCISSRKHWTRQCRCWLLQAGKFWPAERISILRWASGCRRDGSSTLRRWVRFVVSPPRQSTFVSAD